MKKSLASHERSKYWYHELNNYLTPRQVFKGSNIPFWFCCYECLHHFKIRPCTITRITRPSWCPFCSKPPKLLCSDDNCKQCFDKSFASHPRAINWSNKNDSNIISRMIFLHSNKLYWFMCDNCLHDFEAMIHNITKINPTWCPYCCIGTQKLCNNNCDHCFKNSFASSPMVIFYSDENIDERGQYIHPRTLTISSGKPYKFKCSENHNFEVTLNSVTNGHWCSLCKNKTEGKLYLKLIKWFGDKLEIIKQATFSWLKSPTTDYSYRYY